MKNEGGALGQANFADSAQKLITIATSFEQSQNECHVDHLQPVLPILKIW